MLFPFYRWQNQDTEWLSNMPKVTQPASAGAGLQTQAAGCSANMGTEFHLTVLLCVTFFFFCYMVTFPGPVSKMQNLVTLFLGENLGY